VVTITVTCYYGHHLAVIIYLHVAPSSGCHIRISHEFYAADFVDTARQPTAHSRKDSECHTNTTVHISLTAWPYDSYAFFFFLCLHALHTLNLVWPLYIYVHYALWLTAQRCIAVYTDKWAYIIPQRCALCITAKMLLHHSHCSTTRFSANMLFTILAALQDVNRVAPLHTTASTNHRAPWWECRTACPKS